MSKLKSIIAAALLVIAFVVPASAQDPLAAKYLLGDPATIQFNHATQAGDAAILIRYNPLSAALTAPSGTVQVTTTTLLFKVGAAGSEAADSTVTCPSGGTGGTIDLTNAACDTVGEVVDIINASAGDKWKAVNWAAFRTDGVNDKFVASAAASANTVLGRQVVWDTSKTLFFGGVLTPQVTSIAPFINDQSNALRPEPDLFKLYRAALVYANVTHTGTSPQFKIYSVAPKFSDSGSSETITQLYQSPLTSGTNATPIGLTGMPILARKGEKLLIRSISTGTATTPGLSTYGFVFPR